MYMSGEGRSRYRGVGGLASSFALMRIFECEGERRWRGIGNEGDRTGTMFT